MLEILRQPDRTCGLQQQHEIITAPLEALDFTQPMLQHRQYRRGILRQFGGTQKGHVATTISSHACNLFVVSRNDATIDLGADLSEGDRILDQGPAEKRTDILPGQAFGSAPRRNDG